MYDHRNSGVVCPFTCYGVKSENWRLGSELFGPDTDRVQLLHVSAGIRHQVVMECGQFRSRLGQFLAAPVDDPNRGSRVTDERLPGPAENRDAMVVAIGPSRESYADTGALLTLFAI